MPGKKWDQETKAKAIRLVRDHVGDYPSEWAAISTVAGRLGMSAETLRKWIRQQEIDPRRRRGCLARRSGRSGSSSARTPSWNAPSRS